MNNEIVTKFHQGELYDAYKYFGCQLDEETNSAVFRVYAPNARSVAVIGEFNGWYGTDMNRLETGIYELTVENVYRYQCYKYRIVTADGRTIYKSDPYAFHSETKGGTNSKVYPISKINIDDSEYIASINQRNIRQSPVNIYEVHIASWRRYGDGNVFSYRKFADEIVPYLKKMHYTHVEILGVAEYPFDGSWGYQVTGYFAPTSRYGTPEDFAYLVEKLHKNNLGIIIDWVPGHFPKDENGLCYFDGGCLYEPQSILRREHKEWGTFCFDYGRAEVQTFLCSNAMMWFDVYHVDGLRVDAVASMLYLDYGRNAGEWEPNRFGGNHNEEAIAFLQKLNTAVFGRYPYAMMVAEESTAFPKVTLPVYYGGLGFNFKWNMGWMNDTLRYVNSDPVYRMYNHDGLTFSLVYAFSENYVLPISHDEIVHGKGSLINKMPGDYDLKFAGLRNYLMYMYSHPGKKLLMMGSEFGQFTEWNYQRELDWMLLDFPAHLEMQKFSSKLNEFYLKNSALWEVDHSYDGFKWHVIDDNRQNVLIYERLDSKGNSVVVVLNFSPVEYKNYRFGVDKGTYVQKISSALYQVSYDNVKYVAEEHGSHGFSHSIVMDILPMSGVFLKKQGGKKNK